MTVSWDRTKATPVSVAFVFSEVSIPVDPVPSLRLSFAGFF